MLGAQIMPVFQNIVNKHVRDKIRNTFNSARIFKVTTLRCLGEVKKKMGF